MLILIASETLVIPAQLPSTKKFSEFLSASGKKKNNNIEQFLTKLIKLKFEETI